MATCPECQASLSVDKSDNEIKPEAVHRSPGIYLTAEENPEKPQLGDHMMHLLNDVIAGRNDPMYRRHPSVSDLNSSSQLRRPGDSRNFNTQQDLS